jgi:hypothetical protein
MKNSLLVLILTYAVAAADPSDYVNFVRQIQEDSGVEWDVSVAPSGSMLSPEGVGPSGSLFQLWSVHSISANEYHLDEEFVSAYTPSATITIQTGDPYQVIPRTRVDQPFSVRIGISGLVFGNGQPGGPPPSAGQVLLTHAGANYPEGQHSFNGNGNPNPGPGNNNGNGNPNPGGGPHTEIGSAMINSNGQVVLNYPFTNLTGEDLTKVEGEEVWSVHALDGGTGGLPFVQGDVLESATLQIWPIADGEISGVDTTGSYQTLPTLTVSLNDLYPDSTTYLRTYFGPPSTTPSETESFQSSYVIIQDSIPQNRTLSLDGLDDYFQKAGAYTIEIVHETPFGTEVLSQFYPLNIKRSIAVRGSINTSD